jgi:putative ABC transport system permease protein
MGTVWQDIRYGVRGVRKNPGSAAICAFTLALAIGVNTAIFSLVSIVAFADLPMQDPDRLAFVWMTDMSTAQSRTSVSHQDLVDLQENSSFESLAGLTLGTAILSVDGDPDRVETGRVTDNFWETWRVPLVLGRGFLPGEDRPGADPVVILAHGFWQERYAGNPDVLGESLRVNGRGHTVVGVVSPKMEFGNLGRTSIWLTTGEPQAGGDRGARQFLVSGRLQPGVTVQQANEEMAAIGARLSQQYPETNAGFGVHVQDTRSSLMSEELPTIFLLMILSVGFVLLIACANVANMLFARSTSRMREFAVRSALGAGKRRIVRQLLTESLLVSVAAGLMGLCFAHGVLSLMVFITRGREALFTMATLDREVLIFTLIVTMAAPVVFGLLPALRASRADVSSSLKEGGARSGGGRRGSRIRGTLVVSQISLALMLMILAGVAARTVMTIGELDPGFDGTNVLSMVVELPEGDYADDESVRKFFGELLTTASAIPDAEGIGLVNSRPGLSAEQRFEIEGRAVVDSRDQPRAARTVVSPDYMDVMRIPLFQGRGFSSQDTEETLRVALVNQAATDKFWPGEDPIGQRIRLGSDPEPWLQVVGVAGGTEFSSTGRSLEHVPQIYVPVAQHPRRSMTLMVRTRTEPTLAVTASRAAVWSVDPDQPVDDVRTMEQYAYDVRSNDFALLTLFGAFALFALAMAAMGIYGVMSYMVSERRAEISLRMALGAERWDVLGMILRRGGILLAFGTGIGVVGALLLSRLLASLVVGVSERDPITFVGVPFFLVLVALVANYVPAFRATKVDPMQAMRTE